MNVIRIAIDGPASAGKSTIAKLLAKKLLVEYIDTGAMYRAVTLKIMENNIEKNQTKEIESLLNNIKLDFINGSIYLNDINVDQEIRTPRINQNVSWVSEIKIVRQKLANMQRKIGEEKSVLMDGRDIGTNVFPNAEYKFYVTASVEVRAERRYNELISKGFTVDLETVKNEIIERDKVDTQREYKPLRQAEDAILIDTSKKSIEEVLKEMMDYIKK